MTPFPGTRVRQRLIHDQRLRDDDNRWDLYSCFDVVFTPKLMSIEELELGILEIYQTVYSKEAHLNRSRYMIETFKKLKRQTED